MKLGTKEELNQLRRSITELLNFIRWVEWEDEPYFYRPLENMQHNIEIYLYTNGEENFLYEVLSRDWKRANHRFLGIPSCGLRAKAENEWQLHNQYRELLMCIGDFFEKK